MCKCIIFVQFEQLIRYSCTHISFINFCRVLRWLSLQTFGISPRKWRRSSMPWKACSLLRLEGNIYDFMHWSYNLFGLAGEYAMPKNIGYVLNPCIKHYTYSFVFSIMVRHSGFCLHFGQTLHPNTSSSLAPTSCMSSFTISKYILFGFPILFFLANTPPLPGKSLTFSCQLLLAACPVSFSLLLLQTLSS